MADKVRNGIEGLVGRYRHEVHLYETLIKTKLDVLNSDDLFINPSASQGVVLEFLECRVKIQSLHTVIRDLEDILSQTG